jgi:thymidylate synthase (FAD)
MTMMEFRNSSTVELIDWMPRTGPPEARVIQAARVSSGTEDTGTQEANRGLLRMLVRDRHGSPFEHVVFTWRVETPVFVAREFMRHRIASYNETSGRYRELDPVFYVPGPDRPLVQRGKPGAYTFEQGTHEQYVKVRDLNIGLAETAWTAYRAMLTDGVAREVARDVLPLSLFTSFYVTMNLRAFTNFASLRWAHPAAAMPTFPLYEIEQVAKALEADVVRLVPSIWRHFNLRGRRPL